MSSFRLNCWFKLRHWDSQIVSIASKFNSDIQRGGLWTCREILYFGMFGQTKNCLALFFVILPAVSSNSTILVVYLPQSWTWLFAFSYCWHDCVRILGAGFVYRFHATDLGTKYAGTVRHWLPNLHPLPVQENQSSVHTMTWISLVWSTGKQTFQDLPHHSVQQPTE